MTKQSEEAKRFSMSLKEHYFVKQQLKMEGWNPDELFEEFLKLHHSLVTYYDGE